VSSFIICECGLVVAALTEHFDYSFWEIAEFVVHGTKISPWLPTPYKLVLVAIATSLRRWTLLSFLRMCDVELPFIRESRHMIVKIERDGDRQQSKLELPSEIWRNVELDTWPVHYAY